jgi:hypothetical protein
MTTTVLQTIATPSTPVADASDEAPTAEPVETAAPESPASEPAAVETKVEPDPDLEVARRFDAVTRSEAKLRKREVEFQQRAASFEAKEKAIAEKLIELESALEDPVAYYLKKGKDTVEMTKRIARPMSEEEKRIAKLEAAIEERNKRDEEAKKEQETAQQRAHRQAVERQFVSETDPEKYPYLTAIYKPQNVASEVTRLLTGPHDPTDPESPTVLQAFHARHGRSPSDEEIRQALEHQAEEHARELMSRIPKPKSAEDATRSQVTPETPPATEGSPSLSNQHAAAISSGSSRNKSRDASMKELKARLEAESASRE